MSSILDRFKLDGKVAIVTGAARGLGQGYGPGAGRGRRGCGRGGHRSRPTTPRTRSRPWAAKRLRSRPTSPTARPFPGSSPRRRKTFGHLDILVNCAGIIRRADFQDFSEKDWDDVMGININAVFFLSQCFVRDVRGAQGAKGKIINIASMLSFQGGIRVPSYTCLEERGAGADPAHGQRTRREGHQRQRHRARLHGDGQHRAAARRREPQPTPSSTAFRRAAGARPTTSRARSCSWPRPPPITSTATRSRSTAAGWPVDRVSAPPPAGRRAAVACRGRRFSLIQGHVSATSLLPPPIRPRAMASSPA